MPVSYTIEEGYAHCVAYGHYSFEETYNNHKSALDDPLFLPGYNLLVDVADSAETRTYDEMKQIVSLVANHHKFGKKYVIVVNQGQEHLVRYGLARMFSTMAEFKSVEVAIFYDIAEAEDFFKG